MLKGWDRGICDKDPGFEVPAKQDTEGKIPRPAAILMTILTVSVTFSKFSSIPMITSGKSLSQQAEPLSNLQADFWSDKRSQSYAPSATEAAAVDDDQQPDDFPYDEWLVDQSPGNTNTLKAKKSNNVSTGKD